ncbi:MAG: tetratricopeptide repeat protein, partial [Rectinema sp.]|nr:tetratricopeptide repeat protein [Rectinema sp.]
TPARSRRVRPLHSWQHGRAAGIDPEIAYPIQLQNPARKLDPSCITEESLLTGMLRVLAWEPEHENANRYREYIRAIRPMLYEELIAAGVQKAEEQEWVVAEEIFLAASGLEPARPEPLVNLALLHEAHARQLASSEREEEAEQEDEIAFRYYQHLLNATQRFPPAYYHAAFFFLRKHNYDRAVALLTTYIGMSDDEHRKERAKTILEKLKSMGYLDTLFKEAYDFIQMGEEEQGLARASEFVRKYPDVWNGWFLVGWANRRLGRWEDGVRAFETAIEKGAQDADVFNELAICRMELGDLAGARNSLEHALRLEPENIKIIVNLGALAYRQGNRVEAEGFFRAAMEFDPTDRIARGWLERLGVEPDSKPADRDE